MDLVIRICIAIISLTLIVAFFKSIITVTLLANHRNDPIVRVTATLLWSVFRRLLPKEQLAIDRRMIWFWPITLFASMATWFTLVVIAYTGFYFATDSEPNLTDSFFASGSALSTVGFKSPASVQGELITITEGAFGLFIVVYILTFVPGWLSTQQSRERHVAWIYARAGSPPTGIGLINWFYRNRQTENLSSVWADSERMLRNLGATHAQSPALIWARPSRPGFYWVAAIGASIDAAAVCCTLFDVPYQSASRICCQTGIDALRSIVIATGRSLPDPNDHSIQSTLTRVEFDEAIALLRASNAPLKEHAEEVWIEFAELRLSYQPLIDILANVTLSPPAAWLPPTMQTSR